MTTTPTTLGVGDGDGVKVGEVLRDIPLTGRGLDWLKEPDIVEEAELALAGFTLGGVTGSGGNL